MLRTLVARIRGEVNIEDLKRRGLTIGKNCTIIPAGVTIDFSHCWLISIGDNVTISHNVKIIAHDASMKLHLGYARIGKVIVKDNVFIGAGSILLPGAWIGSNTIIGAGSLINKRIPANVVAAGNPVRVLLSLNDFLERHRSGLESKPRFGEEYTIREGVSDAMKSEMNSLIGEGFGYVV
jgi:maltose O-acetyltransferase